MKLSIITINYNNAEGLRKTLESVAAQTYRDFEHIIVDGGSTDGSVEIIEAYASDMARMASGSVLMGSNGDFVAVDSQDFTLANGAQPHEVTQSAVSTQPSIKWISEKDKGIYNAMNKGIEIALGRRKVNSFNRSELVEDKNKGIAMAQGEYLQFLNSGDWLVDENVLQNAVDENITEDIVYGKQLILKKGEVVSMQFYHPDEMSFTAFLHSTLPHQCMFIRASLFEKIGLYNEQNKIVSDWEWNLIALFRWNVSLREVDTPDRKSVV